MSRNFDSRWITQFSALFCVLNEGGQVVTWKLTKNMSFDNIEDQLVSLRERLKLQGKNLAEFYIDNCCSWRNKLQQVFGAHLNVKLDIFHAVKRIGDKISKRHPLRNDCMKELSLVFRDPHDGGQTRLMETPTPSVLVRQLDAFLKKWEIVQYKGWRVLSPSAVKEAQNLKHHMLKGCLTGIKPGRGTNRNEALHKKLNRIVTSSRYGVELAYAMFTTIFFLHNERIAAKKEGRRERVIIEYECLNMDPKSDGYFGIQWLSDGPTARADVSDSEKLTLQRSPYLDFVSRITDSRKIQALVSCSRNQEDNFSSESDDEQVTIPLDALKLILLKALSWYFLHEHMSKQTKRAKIPLKELPFMNSALPKLLNSGSLETFTSDTHGPNATVTAFSEATNRAVPDIHAVRLDRVIKSWNFKRVPMSGDGNCLFYAVAYSLLRNGSNTVTTLAKKLSCAPNVGQVELATLLRQAVVDEWLGENSHLYQSFLTQDQLKNEAHKFLQDGHCSGDLGDLVLPALVNVLSRPVTVFTSAENMPVMTLMPMSSLVTDSHPFSWHTTKVGLDIMMQ